MRLSYILDTGFICVWLVSVSVVWEVWVLCTLNVPSNTQMCKFRLVSSNVSHARRATCLFCCGGDGIEVCWVMLFASLGSSKAQFVTLDYDLFGWVQFNLQAGLGFRLQLWFNFVVWIFVLKIVSIFIFRILADSLVYLHSFHFLNFV